jgi:N-acetylneuraminic acid mutarotase
MPEELDEFTKGSPRRTAVLLTTLLMPALALGIPACSSEPPTAPETSGHETPAAPSFALASNTWAARAPLPFGPCEVAAGLAVDPAGKSTVYVIGGAVCGEPEDFSGVNAYDVASDTWTRKSADYATASPNGAGKIGNKFYVTGGFTFGGGSLATRFTTMAYDFTNDRFIQKADMPKAGGEGVTGVIHDKLYVLPGYCDGDRWPDPRSCDFEPNRQLYRYDPATKNWKTLAPMPTAGPANGAMLRGRLYVIRGAGSLYVYDPVTNIWKTKRGPTWCHEAATRVMIDGIAYLLAVGGSHGSTYEIPNPSELYTP